MKFFGSFPIISEDGYQLRNITLSVRIPVSQIIQAAMFYPYTVKDYESPTSVAFDYYGDISYTWLIALANNIIDFKTQWVKSQNDFEAYMTAKYGSIAAAQSQIAYYQNVNDPSWPNATALTWANLPPEQAANFIPVTAYTDEVNRNEARRSIQLITKTQAPNIALQLQTLLGLKA